MAQKITDENFSEEVLKSDIPVMVDFFAEWCGPCKMLSPIVDDLADENEGKCKVFKVDVDEASSLTEEYSLKSIPTILFFKKGEVVETIMGFKSKDFLQEKIDSLID